MKDHQWDDSTDNSKEFFDAAVVLPVDEADDDDVSDDVDVNDESAVKAVSPKTHFTDLRRRIEERLEGKRINHEFEYDDLDGLLDRMN